jgi:hypothetical protein
MTVTFEGVTIPVLGVSQDTVASDDLPNKAGILRWCGGCGANLSNLPRTWPMLILSRSFPGEGKDPCPASHGERSIESLQRFYECDEGSSQRKDVSAGGRATEADWKMVRSSAEGWTGMEDPADSLVRA